MGWLHRLLGIMTKPEREGISLGEDAYWSVGSNVDIPSFLRALPELIPEDAILCLVGFPQEKIASFLANRCVLADTRVGIDFFIWPSPGFYHLPATRQNLSELADVAGALRDQLHNGEVASHVYAHRQGKVLLEWESTILDDAGMSFSKDVPEEHVKSFCSRLSLKYEKWEDVRQRLAAEKPPARRGLMGMVRRDARTGKG